MYNAYILKSQKDNKYYYGSTKDLDNRLKLHNSNKVKSTKGRTPFVLHYSEMFETRSEAYRREQYFKSIDGYKYLHAEGII